MFVASRSLAALGAAWYEPVEVRGMMMKKLGFAALTTAVLAWGCSDDGSSSKEETQRDAPGFVQIHEQVLVASCSAEACHSGPGIASLSFDDPQAAYDHLLGAKPVNAAAVDAQMSLVVPGDPDASFFLKKMESDQASLTDAGLGGAMPLGAVEVPGPVAMSAIRSWIEAGAPYEGGSFEADFIEAEEGGLYVECNATDEEGMRQCFGPAPDPNSTLRLYSPPMVVQPGEEVLFCNNLPFIAEQDLLFKSVRGAQMRGGHHAGVFVSIQPTEDYTPELCGDDMSHLRYTAGAGGAGGEFTELPPGVGLRISTGQQVVIQSHYINPTDQPITVMDMVELDFTTLEESPRVVDAFAMINDDFSIPAGATDFSRTTECKLEEDMDIYMLLGHTHEWGVLFEFERIPADGGPAELLYHATDGKLLRESPEIKTFADPLKFKAGDTLRVSCTWENDTDAPLGWPQEMCVGLMYYGPGRGWLTCDQDDGVPQGGAGDGEEGCVALDSPGNQEGVGVACTRDGDECVDNGGATVCLAQFDDRANFCTYFGCSDDAECGDDAVCSDQMGTRLCLPNSCA